jgi:hypothetical protein
MTLLEKINLRYKHLVGEKYGYPKESVEKHIANIQLSEELKAIIEVFEEDLNMKAQKETVYGSTQRIN